MQAKVNYVNSVALGAANDHAGLESVSAADPGRAEEEGGAEKEGRTKKEGGGKKRGAKKER